VFNSHWKALQPNHLPDHPLICIVQHGIHSKVHVPKFLKFDDFPFTNIDFVLEPAKVVIAT